MNLLVSHMLELSQPKFVEIVGDTEAFRLMLGHAGQLGANAVIGVRYDATEIGPGMTEVLCYGTAVMVETSMGLQPPTQVGLTP